MLPKAIAGGFVAVLALTATAPGHASGGAPVTAAGVWMLQQGGSGGLSGGEQQVLTKALASYDRGDLAAARGPLLELAKRHPRNGEVQTAAGMVLAESGDVAGSLPFLERARALTPGDAQVRANLGVAYLKLGRNADAVRELGNATLIDDHNVQTEWSLGQAELASGNNVGAARAFHTVHVLDPEGREIAKADVAYGTALTRWNEGDAKGAAEVLATEPTAAGSASAQGLMGEMDERGGRYEAALGHFETAAKIDPSEANVYTVGVELLRHWTFAPAAKMLTYGVEHFPESRRMQLALGIAYYGGSDFKQAIPVFQAMLAKTSEDATVADLLGRSCSAVGAGGESAAECRELTAFARAHPGNAPASLYAAIAIEHRPEAERDTAEAEALLRAAVKADPKLAEAWYELGALDQGKGAWPESVEALERAIALRPAYAEAHYRLSRAYAHIGKQDEARQQIALQQQYSEQEKDALNRRMREVMTFLPAGK